MGSDIYGCIERLKKDYEHPEIKPKWIPIFDLGILGRDYTIFMDVFGWCKEDELGERNWIPDDSEFMDYVGEFIYEESHYKNCIDGKTALERIQKLIKDIKERPEYYDKETPSWYYGGVPPNWIVLEEALKYHTEDLRCIAVIWG